jgi:hypothetical protein
MEKSGDRRLVRFGAIFLAVLERTGNRKIAAKAVGLDPEAVNGNGSG